MSQATVNLYYIGTLATALAAGLYLAVAFVPRPVVAATGAHAPPPGLVPARRPRPEALGRYCTWLALGLLGGAIVVRAVEAGRPPYANLWEYFLVLSFATLAAYAVLDLARGWSRMGVIVLPLALVMLVFAGLVFSAQVEPLVPALRNGELLAIHVASMLLAYGLMTLAFGAAIAHLVQRPGRRFAWLPEASEAKRFERSAVMLGFPILGLGIILGAYWGNIAWGRYWGWDPKETAALLSWLIYAGYLHAQSLRGWRETRTSALAVAGFLSIIFNLLVVNFVISGLHSYA